MDDIKDKAEHAANFLKGIANKDRLLILCELAQGERSVSTLIEETGIAQTSMSQHLNKLKNEGLVTYRRDHRVLYYRIDHPAVEGVMAILYDTFCKD